MEQNEDKQFLETVVRSLVDNPDDVVIDRKVDELGVLLSLSVHPDDMGKIIGRNGNTATAIRTLLRIVGMKHGARVNFKINEPVDNTSEQAHDLQDALDQTDSMADTTKDLDQAIADLKI